MVNYRPMQGKAPNRKKPSATPKNVVSSHVQRKRAELRRKILAAARRVLTESGVEAVTLASVAGEVGLTKQALYHYFPNKEALVGTLVASLLNEEVEAILAAVEATKDNRAVLGTVIQAFYQHYIDQLPVFRVVYCQSQITALNPLQLDQQTLREQVNPVTKNLFDVLQDRLAGPRASASRRRQVRQLAFSAWLAALGLMTMLGITEATRDPLIHTDKQLLDTLVRTFNQACVDAVA